MLKFETYYHYMLTKHTIHNKYLNIKRRDKFGHLK